MEPTSSNDPGDPTLDLAGYALLGRLQDTDSDGPTGCLSLLLWESFPQLSLSLKHLLCWLPARLSCFPWSFTRRRTLSSSEFFRRRQEEAQPLDSPVIIGIVDSYPSPLPATPEPETGPPEISFRLSAFLKKEFLDSIPLDHERQDRRWAVYPRMDCGDGLVCLCRRPISRRLIVVNPVTNTFRLVPEIPATQFAMVDSALKNRSGWATLKLDDASSAAFTLTWWYKRDSFALRRTRWVAVSYSSATDAWKSFSEDFEAPWDPARHSQEELFLQKGMVWRGLMWWLPGRDAADRNCVVSRLDEETQKFVRVKVIPLGGLEGQQVGDLVLDDDSQLLEHRGSVFLVARSPPTSRPMLGIWGLAPADSSSSGGFQLMDPGCSFQLLALAPPGLDHALVRSPCSALRVFSVGEYICIQIRTSARSEYVIAFHPDRRVWTPLSLRRAALPLHPSRRAIAIAERAYKSEGRQHCFFFAPNHSLVLERS